MRALPTGVVVIDDVLGGITPGLPCVIAGPSGSGRTVLSLQVAAAALEQGRIVTLLCNEPAPLLLRQAATLGLPLDGAVDSEHLALLEMDADIAALTQAQGTDGLIEAVRAEQPLSSLWIIDPLSVVTAGIFDEPTLRATARGLVAETADLAMLLTVESERLALQPALERILAEVCGAFLSLSHEPGRPRRLRVDKARTGVPPRTTVEFAIAEGGAHPIANEAIHDEAPPAPAEVEPPALDAPADAPPEPQAIERTMAAIEAGETEEARERPVVLVVDGDPRSRNLTVKWLSERFEVVTAQDGFEAMTWLMTRRPDLVVLDLLMPRVTGYELLSAFQRTGQNIPRLVLSGRVKRPGDRLAPLVLGATDILPKPVDRLELLHKVEVLLRLESPPEMLMDPMEAENLFATISKTRLLEPEDFHARLRRATGLGERLGLPSSIVAISANGSGALDAFLASADEALRFEDATLRVSARRAVLLLVATEAADAPEAVDRLSGAFRLAGGRPEQLAFRVVPATPTSDDFDWHALFREARPEKRRSRS